MRIIESSSADAGSSSESASIEIRLEDASTGDLFASAPYDKDGKAVESVLDSSRYFVLRVQDVSSGNKAYLGIGFQERTDAFDFNVALQESQRRRQPQPIETAPTAKSTGPSRDFSLKEGETISISIGSKSGAPAKKSAPSNSAFGGGGIPLLPPPPSASSVKKRS